MTAIPATKGRNDRQGGQPKPAKPMTPEELQKMLEAISWGYQ